MPGIAPRPDALLAAPHLLCRWNKGALEEGSSGESSGEVLSVMEAQYKVGGAGLESVRWARPAPAGSAAGAGHMLQAWCLAEAGPSADRLGLDKPLLWQALLASTEHLRA